MDLATRAYYTLKPFLPQRLRARMRRIHARLVLRRSARVWPILPGSERPPKGWAGWPEGKQFAFILTHDVEGPDGFGRIEQLMRVEEEQGFRSSFNLVPEGSYAVPAEMRQRISAAGFEVGIHDLHHDGKLYRSREEFSRRAGRINQYVHEWRVTGFRSAYMHHNLDWLADLDVEYDSSTFDTDPFEPQPDGVNTIFPFWVPARSAGPQANSGQSPQGYVELPYTLVQDSTLFLFLDHETIDCWKRKLDWVAEQGGMALVNVHPDYLDFDDRRTEDAFPVSRYRELLAYVRERYAGAYWHTLPNEVSRHVRAVRPIHRVRPPKRVCMLAYTHYESDGRVMRYAEALARRGDQVDAVALRYPDGSVPLEQMNGVHIFRIQSRRNDERYRFDYLWRLLRFLVVSNAHLIRAQFRQPYDLIHVHNIPDFLVFATWLHKLAGGKVILDIHDVVPELYANKFGVRPGSKWVEALKLVEKLSCRFADHVIIANHLWFKTVTGRSVAPDRCTPFVNNVDSKRFRPQPPTVKNGRRVMVFPGSLQWHQGLDVAIEAMQLLREELPDLDLHIYGGGAALASLQAQTSQLGLDDRVFFFDGRPLSEIIPILAAADLGVVPKRSDSFGNEAYSTKIMEFMAVGIPAVVSRTKIDNYYFADDTVAFFEPQNPADLARAAKRVVQDAAYRERLIQNGLKYAEANSWDTVQQQYLDLVDRLIDG